MLNLQKIQELKGSRKITMLTAYSAVESSILAESDLDIILVGDSLGMVFQGNNDTLSVTIDEMIYHAKAVRKGAPNKFIVVDMPFMSYQLSAQQAVENAGRIIKESGANAVKLEGGHKYSLEAIERIVLAGIPVMGHLGFTPQSVNQLSGYKIQGKNDSQATQLIEQAKLVEASGAFSIVIEMTPASVGANLTKQLQIPVIGCGAGADCDGQVLVINDVLGLYPRKPRFAKSYCNLREQITASVKEYISEVIAVRFPGAEHCF